MRKIKIGLIIILFILMVLILSQSVDRPSKHNDDHQDKVIRVWNEIPKEQRVNIIIANVITKKELKLYDKLHSLKDKEYTTKKARELLEEISSLRLKEKRLYAKVYSNPKEARAHLEQANKYHKITIGSDANE